MSITVRVRDRVRVSIYCINLLLGLKQVIGVRFVHIKKLQSLKKLENIDFWVRVTVRVCVLKV
jgi:hypothetical protein